MIDDGDIRFMYMEECKNDIWVIIDEGFKRGHI
jgi:hypothetical protein